MAKEAESENLPPVGFIGGLIFGVMNTQLFLFHTKRGEWRLIGLTDIEV